mmetsp:Transcript_38015/g.111333  ORF Transcript_38015/g.111333 Transcript_38015/m.111333 type:complete len:277 (-) Transcript_38015:40-870(-)
MCRALRDPLWLGLAGRMQAQHAVGVARDALTVVLPHGRRHLLALAAIVVQLERRREAEHAAVVEAGEGLARTDLRGQLVSAVQLIPPAAANLVGHRVPVLGAVLVRLGVVRQRWRAEPVVEVAAEEEVIEAHARVPPPTEQVELPQDTHRVAVSLLQLTLLPLVGGEVGGDEAVGGAADRKGDADAALAAREHLGSRVRPERVVRRAERGHLGDGDVGHVMDVGDAHEHEEVDLVHGHPLQQDELVSEDSAQQLADVLRLRRWVVGVPRRWAARLA